MERQEFLRLLGSAGFAVCAGCALESCSAEETPNPINGGGPSGIDFTLDLTLSANATLLNDGGFLYKSGVIVVCLNAANSSFTAVGQTCTHQGTTLSFDAAMGNFHCNNHGSRFSTTGQVLNGPAVLPLKKYNTVLNGDLLRVFS